MKNKEIYICRCEEITLREVEAAIAEGYTTLNEIKRRTRAGMGLCQGNTCGKLVARLLAEKTGMSPGNIVPATRRPPVRPIKMALFAERGDGLKDRAEESEEPEHVAD